MKYFRIAMLTVLGAALLFSGCEQQQTTAPDVGAVEQPAQNIKIIPIGVESSSLKKVTTESKLMTPEEGGWIQLFHVGDDTSDVIFVYSRLVIRPNTMSDTAEVSLTVDDQHFAGVTDVVFEPHGTTFSQPALLTLYAYGVNLTGVNPDKLSLYYVNEETGLWEPMEYQYMYVSQELGIIYILNGELPHFSRYALGETP